jgi:hypothetical protein
MYYINPPGILPPALRGKLGNAPRSVSAVSEVVVKIASAETNAEILRDYSAWNIPHTAS